MAKLTAAVVQHHCTESFEENLNLAASGIAKAGEQGVKLAVLPELHGRRYFCQTEDVCYFDWAESIPGPTTERLSALARKYKMVIVGSVFEFRKPGIYHNTAVVLNADGALAGCYRKMHIPDDPGYYEKFYFTPGDANPASEHLGFKPIQTDAGLLGVLICWDQWYPEAARIMALAGADVLIYPTAIGWDKKDTALEQQKQLQAWQLVQRSHAVANHLPVLTANRYGFEPDPSGQSPGALFWGNSFICGPQGEVLAQATENQQSVSIAEIDFNRTRDLRKIWPFFRDRRIDAYQALTCRSLY